MGGATYDRTNNDLLIHETSEAGARHMSDTDVQTIDNDAHTAEQGYFLEHVAAGETPERNTVDQGLTIQRILDAVYRSSETGNAVELDD